MRARGAEATDREGLPELCLCARVGFEPVPRFDLGSSSARLGRCGHRGDDGVGQYSQRAGRDPEYSAVGTRSSPDPLVAAQILVHEDSHVAAVSEWRDATHGVTGEVACLAGGGPSNGELARDGGEQTQVNPVAPGDQADDGDQPTIGARGHEDEGLHDLTELGIDGRGDLFGGPSRVGHEPNVERHSLVRGDLDDPLNGWMREIGHVS
jgi:hypothetical protein